MPESQKRPRPQDHDPMSDNEAASEVSRTPVETRRIKIDLKSVRAALCLTAVDEKYGGDEERFKGESKRSIINTFVVNFVEVDPANPDVGWVEAVYYFSDIGYFLKSIGVIEGSRMYAREGGPFTQTSAVNDLMTGFIYQNWDDAKAFQHYMLGCRAISDANKQVIREFLQTSREEIASYYGVDAKVAKELLQRLTFGGGFDAFREKYEISKAIETEHPFLVKYQVAMKNITKEVIDTVGVDKRRAFNNFMSKNYPDKTRIELTLMTYLLQDTEYKAQRAKAAFVVNKLGLKVGSSEHDGTKVEIAEKKPLSDDEMAEKLSEAVRHAVDVDVPVVLKQPSKELLCGQQAHSWTKEVLLEDIKRPRSLRELKEKISTATVDISRLEEQHSKDEVKEATAALEKMKQKLELAMIHRREKVQRLNKDIGVGMHIDQQVARKILRFFAGRLYQTDLGLIMYDAHKGLWTTDSKEQMRLVESWSSILVPGEGSFVTLYNAAYKIIECIAERKDIHDMLGSQKQIGHLLFRNGVLDMANFEIKPFDPSFFFLSRINRKFDASDKEKFAIITETIRRRLFDKPFTDMVKRDYFLELLARGIAGEVGDRQFMMPIGPTACGKGKMTTLIRLAFDEFVGTFDAACLVAGKAKQSMEPSRQYTWLVGNWHKRLNIANEFPLVTEASTSNRPKICPIDSIAIKTLVSGGTDPIDMRLLYQNAINAPNLSSLCIFANDIPPAIPADDAYLSRANCIGFDRGASDEISEDTATHFVKDPSIDDFVAQPEVIDGFVALLCRYYGLSKVNGRSPRPDSVRSETEERTTHESGTLSQFLEAHYVLYDGKVEDFINEETSTAENPKYDRKKIENWYVPLTTLYREWHSAGNRTSTAQFGKDLTRLGFPKYQRKIDGVNVLVRLGLREPINGVDNLDEAHIPSSSMQ